MARAEDPAESGAFPRGVLVLGIQRLDGAYVGTPRAADTIQAGDTLVLYGQIQLLKKLDQRQAAAGDYAHEETTVEHTAGAAKGEPSNQHVMDVGDWQR